MRVDSRGLGTRMRVVVAAVILLLAGVVCVHDASAEGLDSLPNNFPHLNASGFSATFSTSPVGFVDLTTGSQAPGHERPELPRRATSPQQAWSINPTKMIQFLFSPDGRHAPHLQPARRQQPRNGTFTTVEGPPGRVQHAADPRRVPPGRRFPGGHSAGDGVGA